MMNRFTRHVARALCLGGMVLSWFAAAPAAAQETVLYYTTDAIGSVRMVTDTGGAVVERYDYRPFGDPCGSPCSPQGTAEKRQFTGQERDTETGLDYFGARYYSNWSGRFTTADIPGIDQFLNNPQSLSLYGYVRNNPLKYVDENGQGAISAFSKHAFNLARRRAVARAWAAERRMVLASGRGTVEWSEDEIRQLLKDHRVKGYEGHHINSVFDNDLGMAENPNNVAFLTRGEHLATHSGNWRRSTKGELLSRASVAAFFARWDREERRLTSSTYCGSLCASPDSWWSVVNPFNNLLDPLAMIRAFTPDPMIPTVRDSVCFGTFEQCTK